MAVVRKSTLIAAKYRRSGFTCRSRRPVFRGTAAESGREEADRFGSARESASLPRRLRPKTNLGTSSSRIIISRRQNAELVVGVHHTRADGADVISVAAVSGVDQRAA